MIYDFYTIGMRDGLRDGTKDVTYVGSSNSFSIGLTKLLEKITEKFPPPVHGLRLGLAVSKDVEQLRDDDCFLIHVTALGRQWYTGVHYHQEKKQTARDYKELFLRMHSSYNPAVEY